MNISPEKNFKVLLNNPLSALAFIQQKINLLGQLDYLWQLQVDSDLASHTRVANYRNDLLIIETESSAWATRLRYQIPELIKKLKTHPEFKSLRDIKWYIHPNSSKPLKNFNTKSILLSSKDAQLLQETANCIDNKALKAALQNLARKINKS